jgi:hypothetical protein
MLAACPDVRVFADDCKDQIIQLDARITSRV